MSNPVSHTTVQPSPAWLTLSANTEALFQTWMNQALAILAISPETLIPGQLALVTLTTQEHDGCASQVSAQTPASRGRFPNTTCTLSWQHGHWAISSLSNLTQIEESHLPCTEHAFWFGHHGVGYRMQWGAMRHEDTVAALLAWEQSLHSTHTLHALVTLQIDQQEHDITLLLRAGKTTE